MDTHALRVLEFDSVLEMLAANAATEMGAALARALAPAETLLEAERRQTETAEARLLLDSFGGMPFGGAKDLLGHIDKAVLAGVLNGRELLDVSDTLGSAERLQKFLRKHADTAPDLARAAGNLHPDAALARAITEAIDDVAEVRDSASDKLARIRRDLRTASGRIQQKLNSIIQSSALRDALQDPVIVTRHGRWCVPVRSDHKSSVPGIVHDASASGATLFVEPQAVVELSNKLREHEAAEEQEVDRILRQLTARVAESANELRITHSALADLDLANAKALLADELKCSRPKQRQEAYLNYRSARHPLLKGDVVPIDVSVGKQYRGLLITGPNTGGKTVSLKTVGLLALMAQSGLQIPAEAGSESGMFADIFADIGDEQSIEQSLSTFSGHVRNIVHTLANVKPGSLVLFDELGAGTDPAEGAALASAILKWLVSRDVCIIATTHYGELKTFAFANEGFENASVEFDRETLRPTYRLLVGVPGSSEALHVAERLGMPADVLDDARKIIEAGSGEAGELIRQVEASRIRAIEAAGRAEGARREAEGLRGRYQKNISALAAVQQEVRDRVQAEALKAIRDIQADLDQVLRELRTQKRHSAHTEGLANKAKRLMKKMDGVAASVAGPSVPAPPPPEVVAEEAPGQPRPMRKGDRVRMIGVGAIGTLVEDPTGDLAVVAFGAMEARVSPERLELVGGAPAPARRSGGLQSIQMQRATNVSPEIMLRGERVDGALERLDRYLDDACLAGLDQVRVIHGKGTGAMRKAVWEFMRKHPAVASLKIADATEGGEGATIARLK